MSSRPKRATDSPTIQNNQFQGTVGDAIVVDAPIATSGLITIHNNNVDGVNGDTGFGIRLGTLTNINLNTKLLLTNNTVTNRGAGIWLAGATGPWTFPTTNTLTNSGKQIFANEGPAIRLDSPVDVTIENLSLN